MGLGSLTIDHSCLIIFRHATEINKLQDLHVKAVARLQWNALTRARRELRGDDLLKVSSELTRFASVLEFLRTNDKKLKILGVAFDQKFVIKVKAALLSPSRFCTDTFSDQTRRIAQLSGYGPNPSSFRLLVLRDPLTGTIITWASVVGKSLSTEWKNQVAEAAVAAANNTTSQG